MARLTVNSTHQVHDDMMKSARYIVNYCLSHEIGTIIVGYNPDGERELNIGARNNQNFVQIPHGPLRNQLRFAVYSSGTYTSKASFLDDDDILIRNGPHQEVNLSGKRGRYRAGKEQNVEC